MSSGGLHTDDNDADADNNATQIILAELAIGQISQKVTRRIS